MRSWIGWRLLFVLLLAIAVIAQAPGAVTNVHVNARLTVASLCNLAAGKTAWYVKNGGGGSNNGTSWANAWTSFASISWASLAVGDTLYIDGGPSGITYTTSITAGKSGTAGNPITICPGQEASHNGVVTFDGGGATASTSAFVSAGGNDYVTISGNYQGTRHLTVINFYNSVISAANTGRAIGGTGGNDHIVVDYVETDNVGNGVYISSPTNATVRNSRFTNTRGDAAVALVLGDNSATDYDHSIVENNYIETLCHVGTNYQTVNADRCGIDDNHGGPDGIQSGKSITIRYNTFAPAVTTTLQTSDQHPDQVQGQGSYNKIYGNEFRNIADSGLDFDLTTGGGSASHDMRVYNNIFRIITRIDWLPEFIRMYNGSPTTLTNWTIANNVFADNGEDIYSIQFETSTATVSNSQFSNNLFINVGNGVATGGGRGPILEINSANDGWTFDHNNYYRAGGGNLVNYRGAGYSCAGFVAAKDATGLCTLPSFTSYSFQNAGNDFTLQSGDTIAKDAGASLASFFTIDKNQVTRPQGSAWDRGAYER